MYSCQKLITSGFALAVLASVSHAPLNAVSSSESDALEASNTRGRRLPGLEQNLRPAKRRYLGQQAQEDTASHGVASMPGHQGVNETLEEPPVDIEGLIKSLHDSKFDEKLIPEAIPHLTSALERREGRNFFLNGKNRMRVLKTLVEVFKEQNNVGQTIKYIEQLIKLKDQGQLMLRGASRVDALYYLGRSYYQQQNYEQCSACLLEILNLTDDQGKIVVSGSTLAVMMYNLGKARHKQGLNDESVMYYKEALGLRNEQGELLLRDVDRKIALERLYSFYWTQQNYGECINFLRQQLGLMDEGKLAVKDDERAGVLGLLGSASYHQGDNAAAERYLREALDMENSDGEHTLVGEVRVEYLRKLSEAYYVQGKYQEATWSLEAALNLIDDEDEILKGIERAKALTRLGQFDYERRLYERAINDTSMALDMKDDNGQPVLIGDERNSAVAFIRTVLDNEQCRLTRVESGEEHSLVAVREQTLDQALSKLNEGVQTLDSVRFWRDEEGHPVLLQYELNNAIEAIENAKKILSDHRNPNKVYENNAKKGVSRSLTLRGKRKRKGKSS